jgi:cytochrome c oxidase subunit 3
MEIGTAEPLVVTEEKRKRRPGITGGSGGGNNGSKRRGGGGGGGDDNNSDDAGSHETSQAIPNKSRILTAFLLLIVMMTFGGLMAAYVVIHTNGGAEWQPFNLPVQVWISTVIILASSVTYHFAKVAIDREDQPRAKNFLIATTILGAAFISSQILAWLALVQRGLYVAGNPYAGFFYILTAVHVVHVLGGIIALGAILMKTWVDTANDRELARRKELGQTIGWYWHFVDGLWIVLFIMLGFWK